MKGVGKGALSPASSLVYSVLLALAFSPLGGCAEAPTPSPVVTGLVVRERDPISLLPAAVDSILTVDVARLRASAFARPFLSATEGADEASSRRKRGFDEIVDVDLWVFARLGTPGGDRATVEIGRGHFIRPRVAAAFRKSWPGARATQFGKLDGITDPNLAVAFVSDEVLVFGPPWAVREIAAVDEGQKASVRTTEWLVRAGQAAARVAEHAARDRVTSSRRGAGNQTQNRRALLATPPAAELFVRASSSTRKELAEALGVGTPIEQLAARLEVDEAARALFIADAGTPENAEALATQLREALAGLHERPSIEALGLAPILGRAAVELKGTEVGVGLAITARERAEVAAKLAEVGALLAKRRQAGDQARQGEKD